MKQLEGEDHPDIYVRHAFEERLVDLGEVRMNFVTTGDVGLPALLLIPSQTESWWGYELAIPLLAENFNVYAVDVRGQGQSSWTPGRYSLDTIGNDLVRFIDLAIGRPTIVSGLSSGGVLSAWLSAYAKPGQLRGAVYEDAPLFASELVPSSGPSIRQGMGPTMALAAKWLGDQWSIGDWKGMQAAAMAELPPWMPGALAAMAVKRPDQPPPNFDDVPQNMKEYDPEFGRAFYAGVAAASCDHARMLASVRVPVLFTHHFHQIEPETGCLLGAISDVQVNRVRQLVTEADQPFTYRSFPEMAHSMHEQDPELYARTVLEWSRTLAA
mgnify:CR=1 FL=1